MAEANEVPEVDWTAVIGRALAYLSLLRSDANEGTMLEQADFLARFGIPRREAATILGTSDDSLRVLEGRRRRAAGQKKSN